MSFDPETTKARGIVGQLILQSGGKLEFEESTGVWRQSRSYYTYDPNPDRFLESTLAIGQVDYKYPKMFVDRAAKTAEKGNATFFEAEFIGSPFNSLAPRFRIIGSVGLVGNNGIWYTGGGFLLEIAEEPDSIPFVNTNELLVLEGSGQVMQITYLTDSPLGYSQWKDKLQVTLLKPLPRCQGHHLSLQDQDTIPEAKNIGIVITSAAPCQPDSTGPLALKPRVIEKNYVQTDIGGGYSIVQETLYATIGNLQPREDKPNYIKAVGPSFVTS